MCMGKVYLGPGSIFKIAMPPTLTSKHRFRLWHNTEVCGIHNGALSAAERTSCVSLPRGAGFMTTRLVRHGARAMERAGGHDHPSQCLMRLANCVRLPSCQ